MSTSDQQPDQQGGDLPAPQADQRPDSFPVPDADIAATQIHAGDSSASALVNVLDRYLADLQAGKNPDRARLIADHPQLAPQLEDCLGGIEFVHQTSHSPDGTPSQLGDFRIIREVGRGGMGVVYEAEQISLHRRVALKVLRFGGVADREAVQRFQREAETIAGLDHGSIVPVYAVGTDNGIHYYAMQFIDGSSLSDQAGSGPHPASTIARWGLAAAQALSHAHQHGVLHRDVKPSNLLLDNDGRLWLTDFGLARRDIDTTLSVAGALLGTPRYMSPEQAAAARRPVDHRTDIYSLGATLYELATGTPVFDADTPQGVITQILNAVPRSPRVLDPDLPRDLETIILKCLKKDAADRYATAADLADDLRAFLGDRPIRARRPTLIERGVQTLRRHRRAATIGGMSAGMAIVLMIGSLLASRFFAESRLGSVSFATTGPRMIGEIVDHDGQVVASSFPIPTVEPLKLTAGAYQLRLSTDGLMSETWPLEVARGESVSLPVDFQTRWLWPPKELSAGGIQLIDSIPRNAGQRSAETDPTNSTQVQPNSLLLVSHEPAGQPEIWQTRISLIDGGTGRRAWANDLVMRGDTIPTGRESDGWSNLLSDSGVSGRDLQRLVRLVTDLDGDGVADPVFNSRSSPSLLAVSGADGSVLWWYRGRSTLPEDGVSLSDGRSDPAGGSVIGTPAVADVDNDGTSDFVACFFSRRTVFHEQSGRAITAPDQTWLQAVSGRTGESLWRTPLDIDADSSLYSSNEADRLHTGCHVQVDRIADRAVAVTMIRQLLIGVDVQTGSLAWPPYELATDAFQPPIVRDLNHDNSAEILLFEWGDNDHTGTLRVLELAKLADASQNPPQPQLWTRSILPSGQPDDLRFSNHNWYFADDLDNDGVTEIALATWQDGTDGNWPVNDRRAGIELRNAATGDVIWSRSLAQTGMLQPPNIERLIAGPDLDGDGCQELFAAWTGSIGPYAWRWESGLKVVALSGRDGRTLWRWHQAIGTSVSSSNRNAALQWWQPGSDGWPLLVVPLQDGPGGQDTTYFLSASTGRLEHTLSDVSDPHVSDLNGDGIPDLFYRVAPQGAPRVLGIAGSKTAPWKRLGTWQPIADVNDDGIGDFVNSHGTSIASGADVSLLPLRLDLPQNGFPSRRLLSVPLPFGDFNRDGSGDLLVFRQSTQYRREDDRDVGISAVSGRTGQFLWHGKGSISLDGSSSGGIHGWSYQHPSLAWTDLDGDHTAEVLSLTLQPDSAAGRYLLSVWSADEQNVRWQVPVLPGTIGAAPDPLYRQAWLDLNGDGTGDPVLWVSVAADGSTREQRYELQARDGNSGGLLWSAADAVASREQDVLWPRPTVGDIDGDGVVDVAAVMTDSRDYRGGYPCRLVVLDGARGTLKWSYAWRGNMEVLPPLLADFDGNGQRTVCLGLHDGERSLLQFFDPQGRDAGRMDLPGNFTFDMDLGLCATGDFNADGRDELLCVRNGELLCLKKVDEPIWSWPLPDRHAALVRDAFDTRRGEIVVWSGATVHGLSAADGSVMWRCAGNVRPQSGTSHPPEALLIESQPTSELVIQQPPGVLFRNGYADSHTTIVKPAVREASGPDRPQIAPQPRSYTPLADEVPPLQPLPWMNYREPSLYQHLECLLVPSGLTMILMVMIPVWLIRSALRASTATAAFIPAVALTMFASVGTLGPFTQAVSSVIGLLLPVLLMTRSRLGHRASSVALAVVVFALLVAPLIVLHRMPHTLSTTNVWGKWYWVDELLLERLMLALVAGLPGFAFWKTLCGGLRRRDQQQVRRLLVWSTILAAVFGTLVLVLDARLNGTGFHYAWNGWYIIWFWGAFAVGLLALVGAAFDALKTFKARRTVS